MDFCKRILNVKKATINVIVLSELGRRPLILYGKLQLLNTG